MFCGINYVLKIGQKQKHILFINHLRREGFPSKYLMISGQIVNLEKKTNFIFFAFPYIHTGWKRDNVKNPGENSCLCLKNLKSHIAHRSWQHFMQGTVLHLGNNTNFARSKWCRKLRGFLYFGFFPGETKMCLGFMSFRAPFAALKQKTIVTPQLCNQLKPNFRCYLSSWHVTFWLSFQNN